MPVTMALLAMSSSVDVKIPNATVIAIFAANFASTNELSMVQINAVLNKAGFTKSPSGVVVHP